MKAFYYIVNSCHTIHSRQKQHITTLLFNPKVYFSPKHTAFSLVDRCVLVNAHMFSVTKPVTIRLKSICVLLKSHRLLAKKQVYLLN